MNTSLIQQILAPVLNTIGVYPEDGVIVRIDKHEMAHLFDTNVKDTGNYLAKETDMELYQRYRLGGAKIRAEGAVHLSYKELDGFRIEPIITWPDNDNSWIEKGVFVADSANPVFSPSEGDLKRSEYIIALKLSRTVGGKEQRIIVAGDADFMSLYNRRNLGVALYSWPLYNKYPIYANFPLAQDRYLTITNKKAKLLNIILVYGASTFLIAVATIILLQRKRK